MQAEVDKYADMDRKGLGSMRQTMSNIKRSSCFDIDESFVKGIKAGTIETSKMVTDKSKGYFCNRIVVAGVVDSDSNVDTSPSTQGLSSKCSSVVEMTYAYKKYKKAECLVEKRVVCNRQGAGAKFKCKNSKNIKCLRVCRFHWNMSIDRATCSRKICNKNSCRNVATML